MITDPFQVLFTSSLVTELLYGLRVGVDLELELELQYLLSLCLPFFGGERDLPYVMCSCAHVLFVSSHA